ncbi:TonB-dependent receptor plug domain-containing protein [Sphingopyxis panaciterrae]
MANRIGASIFLLGASSIVMAQPAIAQSVDSAAPTTAAAEDKAAADDLAGDTIIVTGTRRTDRTVAQSSVPIDVFSAADITTQASGDMNTIMRTLVPSFNVARFAASDSSTFVRAPTLRGLPPDQILVLVNGKRMHRAAIVHLAGGGALAAGAQGPDISQIPGIALERVEVLRDGAAAQYGSDAIAGVINFTLKRRPDGLEASARYGQYYEGDGENLLLAANVGLPIGPRGFINISGEYADSEQTLRGGVRPSAAALAAARPDVAPLIPNPPMIVGDPRFVGGRIVVNSGIEVGDSGEFYLFGNYGASRQATDFNYRQPLSAVGPNRFGTGTENFSRAAQFFTIFLDQVPGSNLYDVNGRTFNFISRFPGGFTPRFRGRLEDYSAVAGYKGETGFGLNYDLSASRGQNKIKFYLDNTVNPSMGPDSPSNFYVGSLTQRETNFNADFSYDFDLGLASPLTFAFGAEHRVERYIIGAGEPASYMVGPYSVQRLNGENPDPEVAGALATQQVGSNGFPGFGPSSAVNQGRKSYAFYADAEGDILPGLSLGAALRYEHFADFGSTTNYKATARYAFSDAVAVRGAISTGFRAPTPGQLFTTNVATNFVGSTLLETGTFPATTPAAQFFGAIPLKPEKSKNYSAGFVFTPARNLNVTLDFYQIDVRDRIGLSANFDITTQAQRDELQRLGVENFATLGRVRYFTNAFATRTRGIDLVASHRAETGWGSFGTVLSVNYNATKVTSRKALLVNGTPTLVIDDIRKGNIEDLKPKWRAALTENWSSGPFDIIARANYFGPYTSWDLPANGGNLKLGSEFTFDLEVGYDLNKNIRLAVGAENILDNYPDRNIRSLGLPNQNLYVATDTTINAARWVDDSPFGNNGGFWYVRAGVKF